jgi:hypothetical protein
MRPLRGLSTPRNLHACKKKTAHAYYVWAVQGLFDQIGFQAFDSAVAASAATGSIDTL